MRSILAALVLAVTPLGAQTAVYRAQLSPVLTDTIANAVPVLLRVAPPEVAASLPVKPAADAEVLSGTLTPAKGLPQFAVVMVIAKGGARTMYVDLDRNGALAANEAFTFTDGVVALSLPVPIGVFPSLPVKFRQPGAYVKPPETALASQAAAARSAKTILVAKPKPGDPVPTPAKETMYVNVASTAATTIDLGGVKTRFEYQVDLAARTIDVLNGQLYVDANGDGVLDANGNVETGRGNGAPLVFRAGTRYVATDSVDITTGAVIVREHPASDYRRGEMAVGLALRDFAFTDFTGTARRLSDFRGKYVLFDFWGTWCGPCVGEIPFMKEAYAKYRDAGFEIVGLNMESPAGGLTADEYKADITRVTAFLAGKGATWPQAAQQSIEPLAKALMVQSYPVEFLVGPDGKIAAVGTSLRGKALDETLARLLRR